MSFVLEQTLTFHAPRPIAGFAASGPWSVDAGKLMEPEEVLAAAQRAKDAGATRFCVGAAWRSPKDRDIDKLSELVGANSNFYGDKLLTTGNPTEINHDC